MTEALNALFFGRLPLAVARSIQSEPDAWCDTGADNRYMRETYEICHRNGTRVWVANRAFGITIRVPGCDPWGDVTLLSSFGLSPGHHVIWQAAKLWLRERGKRRQPAPPKPDRVAVFMAGAAQ